MINESLDLLSKKKFLEPTEFGWTNGDSCLTPIKREVTLPNEYIIVSGCNKGCKGWCNCSKNCVPSLSFVNVLAAVAICKCTLLIGSYVFLGYLRSILNFC